GEFTTTAPGGAGDAGWSDDGEAIVEGGTPLRELNRRLGTGFPLDGPRTLNGLLLEVLQDLPEGNVSVRFGNIAAEVVQLQDRAIRSVRLRRLASAEPAEAAPTP
nr:transporter associated domain-containing protein [Burkholderiaceae bacterium]